jgi:hypothetical protein
MAVRKSGPNMSQRAVMQHLSLTEWKFAYRLPVLAGELMLSRLAINGWSKCEAKAQLGNTAHRSRSEGDASSDLNEPRSAGLRDAPALESNLN